MPPATSCLAAAPQCDLFMCSASLRHHFHKSSSPRCPGRLCCWTRDIPGTGCVQLFLPGSTSSCSHRVGCRRGTQGTLEETPRAKIDPFLYKGAGSKPELSPDSSLRGKHRARGGSAAPLRSSDCVSELPKPSQLHQL